jgi:hypothetical protein
VNNEVYSTKVFSICNTPTFLHAQTCLPPGRKVGKKGQKIPKLRRSRPTLGPRDFYPYAPSLPSTIGVNFALFVAIKPVLCTLSEMLIVNELNTKTLVIYVVFTESFAFFRSRRNHG